MPKRKLTEVDDDFNRLRSYLNPDDEIVDNYFWNMTPGYRSHAQYGCWLYVIRKNAVIMRICSFKWTHRSKNSAMEDALDIALRMLFFRGGICQGMNFPQFEETKVQASRSMVQRPKFITPNVESDMK
jgi:hypothetical protein